MFAIKTVILAAVAIIAMSVGTQTDDCELQPKLVWFAYRDKFHFLLLNNFCYYDILIFFVILVSHVKPPLKG